MLYTISFFYNATATTEIYTLSLHDALPICLRQPQRLAGPEHEPVHADRLQQRRQVVLGWPPDPADVPPEARGFLRRGPEVHLFDEGTVGMRDRKSVV